MVDEIVSRAWPIILSKRGNGNAIRQFLTAIRVPIDNAFIVSGGLLDSISNHALVMRCLQ